MYGELALEDAVGLT